MAASFYNNSVHVDFESALSMGEPGMVSMFQALIASGLQGFLGCPAVVYEDSLVEFFANGTVRDGLVVSTVNGVAVEISEKFFAETFDLPVDGLADISEMPKDKIFDARSIVSLIGEPAGSFNAITVENFSLLTAVVCDIKMNWGRIFFGFLKKMVTPGTKQAKGFAIQISLLLESVPNLELGASSEFPSSKILSDKTIHRYIAVIDKSGAQDPADAHKIKKAPKTKIASRKRPADIPLDVPVVKRKRTSKKKSTLKLVAVAQEAITIQIVPAESVVEPMVEDQQTETEDAAERPAAEEETPADRPAEEIINVEQRVDESAVEVSGVDVVDPEIVIQHVLNQLDLSTEGQDVTKGDRVETWFDRALAEEIATVGDVGEPWQIRITPPAFSFQVAPRQSSVFAFRVSQFCSVFVDFSVFSWLPTSDITDFLSSIALERTVLRNVQRSVSIVHPNVQSLDQHISSPTSSEDSSMNFDNTDIDATATAPTFSLTGSSTVSLDITKALNQLQASLDRISHREWIGALRNYSNDQRNILSLEFKSSHRQLHTQISTSTIDQIDMHREVKELNAKAQANHLILTTQLGQLIEDLNRGGNDKKGEGVSSRGPQPSRARVPVHVERRPLPTREPSPYAQSSGQYLSA
ncbi:hypothetical protein F511_39635 [Dorcoceras hygrometricum]|uniref:Dystroglycan-like n=1 Tax=Dorcoceras hygrometricum TaxID=472368 RepID=A0A2Z7B8V0_9LAMI|nr:hypothetical protein F511_39635 [Dorcoceras hygrometricum]